MVQVKDRILDHDGTNRTCGLAAFTSALADFGVVRQDEKLNFLREARLERDTFTVAPHTWNPYTQEYAKEGGLQTGLEGLRRAAESKGLEAYVVHYEPGKDMAAVLRKYLGMGFGAVVHVKNYGMGYGDYRGTRHTHYIYAATTIRAQDGERVVVNDSAQRHPAEYNGGPPNSHVYFERWEHVKREMDAAQDGFVIIRRPVPTASR
jgi:hypothetical protein